ncbi:MAG: DUF5115 domain-containing protein [Bacteroidia bacterium]|nr:DUF5115 domain-containing protein [Bacteroidia bacterium]
MKKTLLYTMMLLSACFTACDEDFNKDVVDPQSYPQEKEQTVDGFKVAKADELATVVLTQAMLDANAPIKAFSVIETPKLADGATTSLRLMAAKTADFAGAKELASELIDGVTVVKPTVLNELVKSFYGKAPSARELYVRVFIYINDGMASSMKPTPVAFGPISVTPVGPVIESAYYLYGAPTSWDKNNVLKFSHSGKDVYEDSEFTIMIPAVKDATTGEVADCWFKIASQSSVDAQTGGGDLESVGILGSAKDGDDALEGSLVSEGAKAMKIAKGDYQYIRITLNMMEYTYKIEKLNVSPYIWVPGNHQGWNPATAPQLYTPLMDMVYSGFIQLNGGFKLTAQPAWPSGDHPEYKDYGYGSFTTVSPSVTNDGGNLNVVEGFYYVKADLTKKEFSATKTTWGVIGSATPGGWDTDTDMAYNAADNTWRVTMTFTDGDFKFRANDGWDINMGGSAGKLTFNAGNLSITAGTYDVILHLGNDANSSCELIKK